MEPITLSNCTINGFKTKQTGLVDKQLILTVACAASPDTAAELVRRIGGLVSITVAPSRPSSDTVDMFAAGAGSGLPLPRRDPAHTGEPPEEDDDDEEDDEEEVEDEEEEEVEEEHAVQG